MLQLAKRPSSAPSTGSLSTSEAQHGDLGLIQKNDVLILISNSRGFINGNFL